MQATMTPEELREYTLRIDGRECPDREQNAAEALASPDVADITLSLIHKRVFLHAARQKD